MSKTPERPSRKSDKDWVGPALSCECGATVFWYSAYVLGNFGRSMDRKVNSDGSTHQCPKGAKDGSAHHNR